MDLEENRIKTLESWPHSFISTPKKLAENGFYFIGPEIDKIECFSCGIRMHDWKNGDNVIYEHKKESPLCSFLMNSEENRLETFYKWDYYSYDSIEEKVLAKCGFFNMGSGVDDVQCNFCHVQICGWKSDDDIVLEHYRLSPLCQFLKQHESTANIPIEPTSDLFKLLAPIKYVDYATPQTIKNKYVHITELERYYYYKVKNITFIACGDGEKPHVRVDLNGRKFIIINLNVYERLNVDQLKKLTETKYHVIMRYNTCPTNPEVFNFFKSKKYVFDYQSSERVDWRELLDEGYYKVLLFSIVKINNENQVRVDIEHGRHFILPGAFHQFPVIDITFDNIETWNNGRWMVEVDSKKYIADMVHFFREDVKGKKISY